MSKKQVQIQKKKLHREELRRAKRRKRNQEPFLERPEAIKEEKQRILIVCEGENTEPSYFEKFKLSTATITSVGEGYNTITLVERAEKLSKKDNYDQIWCVFDKDDFPNANFNNAIYKAQGLGFKVAYSNQAFEYWLILHFEDHQGGAMSRDTYCKKLNSYLNKFGVKYDCDSKKINDAFFEVLQSKIVGEEYTRQSVAIKRAERNLAFFDNTNPGNEESSTRVFELIREIEKYR